VDLFAGRYALRYGKVASEAIKKQMAQIPGGLVSYLLPCNTALLRVTIYVIIIWYVRRSFCLSVTLVVSMWMWFSFLSLTSNMTDCDSLRILVCGVPAHFTS